MLRTGFERMPLYLTIKEDGGAVLTASDTDLAGADVMDDEITQVTGQRHASRKALRARRGRVVRARRGEVRTRAGGWAEDTRALGARTRALREELTPDARPSDVVQVMRKSVISPAFEKQATAPPLRPRKAKVSKV